MQAISKTFSSHKKVGVAEQGNETELLSAGASTVQASTVQTAVPVAAPAKKTFDVEGGSQGVVSSNPNVEMMLRHGFLRKVSCFPPLFPTRVRPRLLPHAVAPSTAAAPSSHRLCHHLPRPLTPTAAVDPRPRLGGRLAGLRAVAGGGGILTYCSPSLGRSTEFCRCSLS
eukprot:COSAG01_NODE_17146_length_1174_cov_1.337674_2_plen_170_part_00